MPRRTAPVAAAAVVLAAALGVACSPRVVVDPAAVGDTQGTDGMTHISDLPTADVPDDLRYVFQRRMRDGDEWGDWEIVLGSSNGEVVPILASDRDWSYTEPKVSPDGKYIAVIGSSLAPETLGDQTIFLAETSKLPDFDTVRTGLRRFSCAQWSPDSESVVVSREVATGEWRVSSIDLTTGLVSDLWGESYGRDDFPCGVLVDEARFVYYVRNGETGDVGVWQRDLKTSKVEPVVAMADCFTLYPMPRPGADEVAVINNCIDDRLDGLWLVSLDDGSRRHVLSGLVGAPAWSPDGQWLLFAHQLDPQPTDDPQGTDLRLTRADGTEATKLQAAFATWPSWIPAEADCPLCPGSAGTG